MMSESAHLYIAHDIAHEGIDLTVIQTATSNVNDQWKLPS